MLGSQSPRFQSVPSSPVSLGDRAVEFAAHAGLMLDPWQQTVLRGAMGVQPGGKWAAGQVALLVPRQNGKGSVLEALELFHMFVLDTPTILHSAHKFDTSQEHFLRMQNLIDGNPDLSKHIKSVYTANGKESITLRNGCRLKFKARTVSGSGRGFSSDLLILDEAMFLPDQALAAMLPTLAARPNPQVWYTSSAGYPDSDALWRLVKRGREGAERLAYFEWGCEQGTDPEDRDAWAQANPSLGYRLLWEKLEDDLAVFSPDDFAREHLGIWDDQANSMVLPGWDELADPASVIARAPTFAVEVAEDRSWACIAAAGACGDRVHVESGDYQPNTGWIVARAVELAAKNPGSRFVIHKSSPAGSLIADLENARVPLVQASTQDYAQACGDFFDAVVDASVAHAGQGELDTSVRAAKKKFTADAFVWDRRKSDLDISPLVAVTLAHWGHVTNPPQDLWAGVL